MSNVAYQIVIALVFVLCVAILLFMHRQYQQVLAACENLIDAQKDVLATKQEYIEALEVSNTSLRSLCRANDEFIAELKDALEIQKELKELTA